MLNARGADGNSLYRHAGASGHPGRAMRFCRSGLPLPRA
jgi:hypothetical protein